MPKSIEISILGQAYPTIKNAAQVTGIPIQRIRRRLESTDPEWSEWKYLCDPAVGTPPTVKPKHEFAVCYQITNKENGSFYVGSTWDVNNRMQAHLSVLRHNKHHSPKLQELWNRYPDEKYWDINIVIFKTKEEAIAQEQKILTEYNDSPLLLNAVYNARSPISGVLDREGALEEIKQKVFDTIRNRTPEEKERVRKAQSAAGKKAWAAEGRVEARMGAGNPFARKVMVDGVVYGSVRDAQAVLCISEKTIRKRANSDAYPNYSFDVTQM